MNLSLRLSPLGEPQDIALVYDAGQLLDRIRLGLCDGPYFFESLSVTCSMTTWHLAPTINIVISAGSASHRLELWSCKKGSLKPLRRLKVNQAREIKEAHRRHHGKEAGDFEPARPSRVGDRDVRQPDLRLSKRRRGSHEHQPERAAAHPNESDGEADAKDNFARM